MTPLDGGLSDVLHAAVPDPPITVDYDGIRHRAQRRRRTRQLVPLAVLSAAAVSMTIYALAPTDQARPRPAPPAGTSRISTAITTAPPTGGSTTAPIIGVAYAFQLYSHCGIRYASFGGRLWSTATLVPEPTPRPDKNGITNYTGYTPGTMTLINPSTLVFAFDTSKVDSVRRSVTFHPTHDRPPLCG